MDPEQVKQAEVIMAKGNEKVFGGPPSEEFNEFLKTLKPVDYASVLPPTSHAVQMYWMDKVCMPPSFIRGYFESRKVTMRSNDVVLASFPKTGTTWVQKILDLILTEGDVEKSNSQTIDERVPYLEWPECTLKALDQMPSPKFVKTHQPYSMLPDGDCDKKYKIIYTTRNPKDTAVSLYHFYKMIKPLQFVGDIKDIVNLFLNDQVLYAPFSSHVLGYWERRHDSNVLIVKYEDLQRDARAGVKRIAAFLDRNLTEDQVDAVVKATTFKSMAANPNANHEQWGKQNILDTKTSSFLRKGEVGDWKNHFDEALNKTFDEWIEKNFKNSDLDYDYE